MQTVVGEAIGGGGHDVERIAGHIGCAPGQCDGFLREAFQLPIGAVSIAVDGVVARVFVDRQRVGLAFEGVFAAFDAVRERDENLAMAAAHHVIRAEGDDKILASVGQFAQRCAEFGDDRLIVAVGDGELLSGAGRQVLAGHRSLHNAAKRIDNGCYR